MFEDFRARMDDLRQEMDRLTKEADELGRVVQEQQVRLEEMDLQVRQRDEQLAERQARVEELEKTLQQRDQEVAELRSLLIEGEESQSKQEEELESLRAQLAQREVAEVTLREELTRIEALMTEREKMAEKIPAEGLQDQLSRVENLLQRQGKDLSGLRSLVEEEMSQLHNRLDRLESSLAMAPISAEAVAPVAVAIPPVEEVVLEEVPPLVEEVITEEAVAPPAEPEVPVAVEVPEVAVAVEDPLQALLYEVLNSMPAATFVALSSLDGLMVEAVSREGLALNFPLEVELADLAASVSRVASALGTGPLLTMAFQIGKEHCLLSPVNEYHFAFMIVPSDSIGDFRHAQAILMRTASLLGECC